MVGLWNYLQKANKEDFTWEHSHAFKTKQIRHTVYNRAHNDLQQLHYFDANFMLFETQTSLFRCKLDSIYAVTSLQSHVRCIRAEQFTVISFHGLFVPRTKSYFASLAGKKNESIKQISISERGWQSKVAPTLLVRTLRELKIPARAPHLMQPMGWTKPTQSWPNTITKIPKSNY